MGKNNRQRRAAKARKRSRPEVPAGTRRPGSSGHAGGPQPSVDEVLDRILASPAARAGLVTEPVDRLVGRDPAATAPVLRRRLAQAVTAAWERGWQPSDLDRFVRRNLDGGLAPLLQSVLAEEAADHAALGRRVAPAWMAQLDGLGAAPASDQIVPHLLDRPWADAVQGAVALLAALSALPTIPRLVDPPSAWVDGPTARPGDVPAALLARIRAMLAKAESTTFDAEAEAFTAKAQELMARHRIDRAVLADADPHDEPLAAGVVGRRISIDDPYATAKFHLLAGLAEVNGARAVWSKYLGMSTVFGFPVEVDIIEELFTSLLVQATAAMAREGSKTDHLGRNRTKAFRRSFLLAFADRIAFRLGESVERVVDQAAAEAGTDLVPILAARDEAVATKVDELFPRLRSMSASISDAEGVYAGRLAADRADLSAGPPLHRSA